MLRLLVVVVALVDILLKQPRPRDIVHLRNVVAVRLQGAEELVESESGVAGDLSHSKRRAGRVECRCNDNPSDVVDWNHVDRVIDVRTCRELDTSLDHSDEEVIRIGSCGKYVSM